MGTAHADEPAQDSKLAHDLFDQGRALLEQHEYERACQKFEDSRRLTPTGGGGTVLNLALCRELSGKTGTAWALFREARSQAVRDRREDRQRFAEEHLAALDRRISRLRITVPLNARAPGLVIRLNTVALTESAWGESLVVDPGEQHIDVTAPDKQPLHLKVVIADHADHRVLDIPPLSDRPKTSAGAREEHTPFFYGPQRKWGTFAVTAGLATVAIGSLLGVRAGRKDRAADALCPSYETSCNPDAFALSSDAASEARTATVVVVSGAVVVVAGVVLFLTAPSKPPSRKADASPMHPWMLTF